MDKVLKFLKTEAIGGLIIRFSLAGLLLFGGFAKLIFIGEVNYNLAGAILIASIETISAIGLLYHYRAPMLGVIGGGLALVSIIIRFIYSLYWIKGAVSGDSSIWGAFLGIMTVFNNGLFYIILLFGAAIYCMGNSYKAYFRERITQPWPK